MKHQQTLIAVAALAFFVVVIILAYRSCIFDFQFEDGAGRRHLAFHAARVCTASSEPTE